jgi:hypothetical protein
LPFVAILCCSVVYLVTLIFPDLDDPSLRGFRGLVIMLGLVFALLPVLGASFGIGLLARSLSLGPIIAAVVAALVAIGISTVVCMISGNLYAQFNPSE